VEEHQKEMAELKVSPGKRFLCKLIFICRPKPRRNPGLLGRS
jgi:hypothetical protein